MEIEYDAGKNKRNIERRGISFDQVLQFDFDTALEFEQVINGEVRYFALGSIAERLYALVYTIRGNSVRIISLRKANKREVKMYESR